MNAAHFALKRFRRCILFRAMSRIWWLLAMCGIADAMCAAMNLLMLNPDRSPSLFRLAPRSTVWDMSMLALWAGACAIAAGLLNSGRDSHWLLSLHGLALGAFGLIGVSPLIRGPLSFRPISLLFVVTALCVGAFAFRTAQTQRSGALYSWFLSVSGAASIGFAFSFMAVGFGWVRLKPPHTYWIWMTSYFAFCAIFMLTLAWRGRNKGVSQSGLQEILPPIRRPKHAQ